LAGEEGAQPALFDEEQLLDRHVGTGEFGGLEFLHVNARRIVNPRPLGVTGPLRVDHQRNGIRGRARLCCRQRDRGRSVSRY
jgi:hypothetical protein